MRKPGQASEHSNNPRDVALERAEGVSQTVGASVESAAVIPLASGLASGNRAAELIARPGRSMLAEPPPRATYRLQFQKDFTFEDAIAIVPYLAQLGVSHVYASPVHKARPGSLHGYDVVDHTEINPELGGEEAFRRLSDALKKHGLGLVLDIVPNHVGVGADNGWWLSVLEWGELSPHAPAFDIDWDRLGANRKLVVPFLGSRYGVALEKGELNLSFDPDEGSFSVSHFEHRFPLCPLSYPIILDRALAASDEAATLGDVLAVSERLRVMGEESVADRRTAFPADAQLLKQELSRAVSASSALGQAVERAISMINGAHGVPESFGTLHRLLEAQSYRLAHWRVAASDINYRRFFDINGLAGLRIEEPEVFERVHATVFRLIREGRVNGLRIDHIDGLADPGGYLRSLQSAVGPGFFILVEKILEPGEDLRPWPIAGTTGYDMLNLIDGVLLNFEAAATFERIYRQTTGIEGSYPSFLRRAKVDVLETAFASELEALVSDLKRIADSDRHTRDYTVIAIRGALREIIARFPVYRSYIGNEEPLLEDRRLIEDTVTSAQKHSALPDRSVHAFITSALLDTMGAEDPGRPDPELVRRFRRRFQQLTGPVMAKGLEDTLFYRYARLLALNEVGGDPGRYGVTPAAFHAAIVRRVQHWPHAMIATATHDTKRGEDARARLLALSQQPEQWAEALRLWQTIASPHLAMIDDAEAPDANDQFIMLQALLGAWPTELLDREFDAQAAVAFGARMEGFLVKALREAKVHTSWVNPNEAYEAAAKELMRRLTAPNGRFLREFAPFARRLATLGMLAALARTVLKCTLPGVPDIYQGTEFWDLSLVDPDNRRTVDYTARSQALKQDEPADRLLARWSDGHIKQRILARILGDRAAAPVLYSEGDYHPLDASGPQTRHVLAFRRSNGPETLITAVCRLLGHVISADKLSPPRAFWGAATLPVPAGRWREVTTEREFVTDGSDYPIRKLFAKLPIAVLRSVI
ncbi:(1-_4)-alpha-D-glucan 1-alpha-D-glucosylmutase [Rhizobiales bacterium GAS113]|nr:(1->4)-alpha-D-glucan 1-alpha-D-glucosylmutase [Rhizobiales bacterium GAS113]